jgi:hypothetical protein
MPNRAYDAKNTVNQHPRSKEQHKCRGSHNRMSECDYSEHDCSDTPYHLNPPMTFKGFDKHDPVLGVGLRVSKLIWQIFPSRRSLVRRLQPALCASF